MAVSFLVFADLHHEPKVFPHDAKRFLDEIIARGINTKVSFMVQLGDFLHTPQENRALADVFAEAPIPAYNVFGNHDNDQESYEYILDMYRLRNGYYYFDREGYRFIVLDPNYSVVNGELVHYNPNQARSHNLGEIPPDQMSWLEETIFGSPFPCILFSHQSLERTDGIKNRDEVWRIICRANRSREHAVILCVNGHYHCDYGIVPYPKFDSAQAKYYSTSTDDFSLILFPSTVTDLDFVGCITEAMCAVNSAVVVPAYYDIALKDKYNRDQQSAEMLDIIRENLIFDVGYLNSYALNSAGHLFVQLVREGQIDFASSYARNEKIYKKMLQKMHAAYED